jgi:hypothetical protein
MNMIEIPTKKCLRQNMAFVSWSPTEARMYFLQKHRVRKGFWSHTNGIVIAHVASFSPIRPILGQEELFQFSTNI